MSTYTNIRYNYNLPSGSGGGLTLLSTNTITSGVSSSSFTSGIDSTYRTYIFKLINIHPSSNDIFFQVNFRDGSSAFDATKTTTTFGAYHGEDDSGVTVFYDTSDDLANSTGYQNLLVDSFGNGNDEGLSGEMYLFSPSSTTFVKHFLARTNIYHDSDFTFDSYIAGYIDQTSAIDGVDFKCSSGNIDSGVIKMYGIV